MNYSIAYISDQSFFVDKNGEWYTTSSFYIDEILKNMKFVNRWTFYGRLYKTESVDHLFKITSNLTHVDIDFKGTWEQKKGGKAYLKNLITYIICISKLIQKSDIIWLKFNFVASYIASLIPSIRKKIIISHMVGDIDCLADFQTNLLYRSRRIIQKLMIRRINKMANLEVFVSNDLCQKYAVNAKQAIISHENRMNENIIARFAEERSIINDVTKLVFVGRLSSEKGIFVLLDAMAHLTPNVTLSIIGDGNLKSDIEKYIKNHNLDEYVKLEGTYKWGEELFYVISKNDILILPSFSEGQPLVILEGMGLGLPVIASNVGGISEIITPDYNGLLFKPNNIMDIVNSVTKIRASKELYNYMSKNAITTCRLNTIETQVSKITMKINELVIEKKLVDR